MLPSSEWQTFLAVQAGAAATLSGLVFVAVSINLARIMEVPGLPGRAAESLVQILQVFFIASAALIPHQPAAILAGEILCIGTLSWLVQSTTQIRYWKASRGHPWSWLISRVVMSQLATMPFWVAGVLLFASGLSGYYWLLPGFAFSFIAGVTSAWVLLVEILR